MKTKRALLTTLAALAAIALIPAAASAQGSVPLRLVVGFTPGSASDIVARVLASELQKDLGQVVIVDNKPGASAMISAEYVAKAAPDGNTLLLASNTALVANQFLFKSLRYDPVKDLTPIARLTTFPTFLVVGAKFPATNVREFLDYARKPGSDLFYAYGNSTGQVAGSAFARAAGITPTAVPYKSTSPALMDIVGGTVDFIFVDLTARPLIESGALRAIGVASREKSVLLPSAAPIPDVAGLEAFEISSWHGVHGPANMDPQRVQKLHAAFNRALNSDTVREKFKEVGAEPVPMTLPEYIAFFHQQLQQWEARIKDAGMTPE